MFQATRLHPAGSHPFVFLTVALVAALILLPGCREAEQPPPPAPAVVDNEPPEGAPRLVLMIVVDQLRADYLERFAPAAHRRTG